MKCYLEITFRQGKPLAAYFYLPRQPGDKSARTKKAEAGLIVDFSSDGRPIGIEITAPSRIDLATINRILISLHQAPATPADFAPLLAA